MKKYYNGDRIDKVDAIYKMLLGGRNIGKSYDVKTKRVLEKCYKNNAEFTYLRRWDSDIKGESVKNYFADVDISKITDGVYKDIYVYSNIIYLCNYDKNGRPTTKKKIGYSHALNLHERYKSQMFPKVICTIYEEFITDALYLPNEPDLLQDYVSTIYRERVGTVWLIGNTISKICPYYKAWGLDNVGKMKTHDINIFENTTPVLTEEGQIDIVVRVAVEMCGAENVFSKMAFGESASMIIKNEWKVKKCARIDEDVLIVSKEIYSLFMVYDNLQFKCRLMMFKNNPFWYIEPFTKEIKHPETTRIITRTTSPYYQHTESFYPLNNNEARAFELLRQGKIFYCSDECGTDFKQVIKMIKC